MANLVFLRLCMLLQLGLALPDAFAHSIASTDQGKEDEITIAFIFPFNSQKVYITDLSQSKYFFPEETRIAVEFYQGALLALDSLKETGLKANILVYDCGGDSAAITRITRKSALKKADLIFAPFNGNSMQAVVEFGLREKIPVVSPLSVFFSDTAANPFLILANPTMKTHARAICDYMEKKAQGHRSILIYQKTPADLALVSFIKSYAAERKKQGEIALRFVELTDSSKTTYWKLKDSLFKTDENHIFIPCMNESVVSSVLKQLVSLKETYNLSVYGMPTWSNLPNMPAAYFDSLDVVISESFWIDKYAPSVQRFHNLYHQKYEVDPSVFSVRGYDEALFFAGLLMQHDTIISHLLTAEPTAKLATRYDYRSNASMPQRAYLENRSVMVLERKNGRWIPVID